ncbi:MAG: peptidoglycan DD-metalloendopeptidase family protein [Desulfuromonas sp.]|nr:peptidoglycan DD-metalloendopeptidase family protein [Desulfuromonas sp.]
MAKISQRYRTTVHAVINSDHLLHIVVAMFFVAHCSLALGSELEDKRDSLQQVKQQISKTADKLQEKQAAEKSALQQLEQLEQQIARNDDSLSSAANAVKQSRREIEELKEKIEHYSVILGRSQKDVEKRLSALYTSGDMSSLRLIFSTETPLELAENLTFLGRISAHDKKLLTSYRQRMQQFRQAQLEMEEHIEQQKKILQKQREQKHQLAQSKSKRSILVKKIRRDTTTLHALLKELEDRSARMTSLVQNLEKQHANVFIPSGQNFAASKGQIPWPSSGAVRTNFGTQKDENFGGKHKNNGVTIAAVAGTKIKAIWDGRIAFSSPFKGYGNLIIIDHGYKYYSLYAQAAQLNLPVGTVVKRGEVITTSGLDGRDSYYLEIRHASTPLDPKDWLQPRQ